MERSVLLVDDDPDILKSVGDYLTRVGNLVHRARTPEEALEQYHRESPMAVVLDLRLPGVTGFELLEQFHQLGAAVIVLTGFGDVETAVSAVQRGADNFLTKPVELPHLVVSLERLFETVRLKREVQLLRSRRAGPSGLEALGVSKTMTDLAAQMELLAKNANATVLLTGESGTGKGYLARLIHDLSPRAERPFVDVNCAGLTSTFVDSELFGHERGAFTDAKSSKQGLFEIASDGSVFLDEIGDLPADVQPKLLKALESKTFRRMGGTREISVDTRVIAATNRNLKDEIAAGRFREDLFYRLSVVPVHLPPLRERTLEDRTALLHRLLAGLSNDGSALPSIDPNALDKILNHSWPGNIREMRNVLERALILAHGGPINVYHLPVEIRGGRRASDGVHRIRTVAEVEKLHIERTVLFHKGNRTAASKDLGISRATLINKIKAYALDI